MNLARILFFLLLFLLIRGAHAQADDERASDSVISIEKISLWNPQLRGVRVENDEPETLIRIGINDRLVLTVRNLKALLEAKESCAAQSNCKRNIVLYLNDLKISELAAINLREGYRDGTITFDLKYDSRNSGNKQNWTSLLGAPIPNFGSAEDPENGKPKPGFFTRPVNVAIGLDDGSKWIPFENIVKQNDKETPLYVLLEQVNPLKFIIFVSLLIIMIGCIWWFQPLRAALKESLSDIGTKPETGSKPWSLARCQMAFWSVLVAVSFVSIWVTTGALNEISDSALALIGIGTGAALGSAAIDVSGDSQSKRIDDLESKLIAMQEEAKTIEQELLQNQTFTADQKRYKERMLNALQHNQALLRERILRIAENNPSQSFLRDILSDPEGNTALHRVQILIWTLILGIIYVHSVWETLAMPEFSPTLLALQGLSAGAYLGFKIPDKKS